MSTKYINCNNYKQNKDISSCLDETSYAALAKQDVVEHSIKNKSRDCYVRMYVTVKQDL